ncbi:hypothetical protein [Spongiimicrobium sp. 3-5]|uniref:hypothetical protein n=1 Tax=Spongiimicrobium sp. 3-5 TaxID=3332596 RepID=UPI00397FD5BB
MENLSRIEKQIIDYLIESDSIGGNSNENKSKWNWVGLRDPEELPTLENRFVIKTHHETMASQKNQANIEDLIRILFKNDYDFNDAGILIDLDIKKSEPTIHLMEKEYRSEFIIIGNWLLFEKVNYILVKISNFLNQLESDGFVDKISIRNSIEDRKNFFPYYINCSEGYNKTLEIKNKEVVNNFINCFCYNYVPNYKLIEFKNNNYQTTNLVIAANELKLSKRNIKLAKFGLITAIFSAFVSLIAIVLTLYSIGIPASVKIDESQVKYLKEVIRIEKTKPQIIVIDTINQKK